MLVYSPLKEDESNQAGWYKATVNYVMSEVGEIRERIRAHANRLNYKVQVIEIDDIYAQLLIYLYNANDYELERAYEKFR